MKLRSKMMIQGKGCGLHAPDRAPALAPAVPGRSAQAVLARQRRRRAAGCAAVAAAVLAAGCTEMHGARETAPGRAVPAESLVRHAKRVTITTAGRTTASDGVTLRLSRFGGRWLVSAILLY